MKIIDRPKIRDVVASRLKAYITEQQLRPGDRLPTETELAVQFGVSRLSLREATKALEFLGILEAKPGRGLTVGQVNIERVTEYLGFHPSLHDALPDHLIETRIVIEIGVLPYVMQKMQEDPGIHAELKRINDELRRAKDLQFFIELDIAFHRCLVESSGLTPLLAFNDLLSIFFLRFRESVKKAAWMAGIEGHRRIIDALKDQDLKTACDELRRHIEHHREQD